MATPRLISRQQYNSGDYRIAGPNDAGQYFYYDNSGDFPAPWVANEDFSFPPGVSAASLRAQQYGAVPTITPADTTPTGQVTLDASGNWVDPSAFAQTGTIGEGFDTVPPEGSVGYSRDASIEPTPIPFKSPGASVYGYPDIPTYDPNTGSYSWSGSDTGSAFDTAVQNSLNPSNFRPATDVTLPPEAFPQLPPTANDLSPGVTPDSPSLPPSDMNLNLGLPAGWPEGAPSPWMEQYSTLPNPGSTVGEKITSYDDAYFRYLGDTNSLAYHPDVQFADLSGTVPSGQMPTYNPPPSNDQPTPVDSYWQTGAGTFGDPTNPVPSNEQFTPVDSYLSNPVPTNDLPNPVDTYSTGTMYGEGSAMVGSPLTASGVADIGLPSDLSSPVSASGTAGVGMGAPAPMITDPFLYQGANTAPPMDQGFISGLTGYAASPDYLYGTGYAASDPYAGSAIAPYYSDFSNQLATYSASPDFMYGTGTSADTVSPFLGSSAAGSAGVTGWDFTGTPTSPFAEPTPIPDAFSGASSSGDFGSGVSDPFAGSSASGDFGSGVSDPFGGASASGDFGSGADTIVQVPTDPFKGATGSGDFGSGLPPVIGDTSTGTGSFGAPAGAGVFQNGTWVPGASAGTLTGTSYGDMGYSLIGVPGTFVTTPLGDTYSTAVGMFGLGAMNAAGASMPGLGAGNDPQSGIQMRSSGEGGDTKWKKGLLNEIPGIDTKTLAKAQSNPDFWAKRIMLNKAMLSGGPGVQANPLNWQDTAIIALAQQGSKSKPSTTPKGT